MVNDANTFSTPLKTKIVTSTSWTYDSTLSDGTYYWRVFAKDIDSKPSSWSITRTFTLFTPLSAPILNSPANQIFTTDTTPTFDWSDVSGAVDYQIQIDNVGSYSNPKVDATSSVSTFTSTALSDNSKYYWHVRARDGNGNEGIWSSNRAFTVDTTILSGPVLTSPTNGANLSDDTPTFTWNSIAGANTYRIEIDNSNDFTLVVKVGNPTINTYTSTALNSGTYYWRVRGFEINNNVGEWSEIRSFAIVAETTSSSASATSTITITTTSVPDGSSMNKAIPANIPGTLTDIISSTDYSTWFIVSLNAGTEYEFRLDADIGTDIELSIYGANGQPLFTKSMDSIISSEKSFTYTAPTTQSYYLLVKPKDFILSGNYNIIITIITTTLSTSSSTSSPTSSSTPLFESTTESFASIFYLAVYVSIFTLSVVIRKSKTRNKH